MRSLHQLAVRLDHLGATLKVFLANVLAKVQSAPDDVLAEAALVPLGLRAVSQPHVLFRGRRRFEQSVARDAPDPAVGHVKQMLLDFCNSF